VSTGLRGEAETFASAALDLPGGPAVDEEEDLARRSRWMIKKRDEIDLSMES
jgi:hypothetical protein